MTGASCVFTSGCLTISFQPLFRGLSAPAIPGSQEQMGEPDIENKTTDNVVLKRRLHEGKVQFARMDSESLFSIT